MSLHLLPFAERLAGVEERIESALARCGRKRSEITVVAVTKKFPAAAITEAYSAGLRHFGENYVQEFVGKRTAIGNVPGASFHLIGHLQSNKTRQAAELFDIIAAVDSAKIAQRLGHAAGSLGKRLECLIEVKLSPEENKTGAAASDVEGVLEAARAEPSVDVTGLMTVPPWSANPEDSRPYFARLAELLRQFCLSKLSMGMSADLEVAIEEGATILRIGTALFGPRPKPL